MTVSFAAFSMSLMISRGFRVLWSKKVIAPVPPLAIKEHALTQAHGAPPPSARKARWPGKVPCLPPFKSPLSVLCSTRNRVAGKSRAMKVANTIAIGVGVVVLGVLARPADAERWRQAVTDPAYPHITVQSELYPSETISAPVRSGPRGDEVRLPGGTWVPCGFNCYFTLRNATIDFWRRYDVFPQ